VEPEDFKRATEVSYLGYVWGTRVALQSMKPRNEGVIIQVGSAMSYRAIPLQSAYCGAKFAIRGFTDAIRSELIHDNSRVHLCMVQLSAFNTPQFNWGRTTLKHQPQPLPPIFQPEVAADAIVWASHHRRRELWVGGPAVQAITGNRLLAPLLDKVLAKKAYKGQRTDEPLREDRIDNLYEPVPDVAAIHGRFDQKAKSASPQLWANEHRGLLAGTALAFVGGAVLSRVGRRASSKQYFQ
jgi:hypothetical protein